MNEHVSERNTYVEGQITTAQIANMKGQLDQLQIPDSVSYELIGLERKHLRGMARKVIRQSEQIGSVRDQMGLDDRQDAITHRQAVELLRLFHVSRRKKERRKSNGHRK